MRHAKLDALLTYAIVCGSGAVSMAFEILGSRVLAPDFGSTIFVWGSLIGVFLAALSIGYAVGGRLSERFRSMAVLGLLVLAPGLLLVTFPLYGSRVSAMVFDLDMGARLGPLTASCCLFFAPTVFFGTVSPFAAGLLAQPGRGAGRGAGDIFAISTLGSIAGTLGTAFYLILWMGTRSCLILLGGVLIVLSLAALGRHFFGRAHYIAAGNEEGGHGA
jgi:hypothetical protein